MSNFIAEFIGTALLILLGNGVVANVVLKGTKGNNSGWIVITFGWGMAVFVAVFTVSEYSGAHINPAVTLGLAAAGVFEWAKVPIYILAQLAGGATGAFLVWLFYRQHVEFTEDKDAKLAIFATIPAIRSYANNLISEIIGTFVLVFAVLYIASPTLTSSTLSADTEFGLGALGALPVGFLVFSLGLSLGGTTGYAINPARDLAPRFMHQILPVANKRDSDWAYAWVPILGPIIGGVSAGLCYLLLQ
ncbi:aquaporin family protein [Porifericola rhodea]|uniref:MIP/aquaporin family protein n=1 Tax=Porifericola rhodea TaxID=930972 RepID=UPI002666A340|nr:MIP/aquaporin family protein [Porifericola rhodea]WKN32072.1 aquaporin family protein [Porifericola rhodea]